MKIMSHYNPEHEQEQNTAKLVMSTLYKVARNDGVTAAEITKYLQDKFGKVWRINLLTGKAEETLKRSAALGFLNKKGDRYVPNLARELRFSRKRKRQCRQNKRRCCPRRRRRR